MTGAPVEMDEPTRARYGIPSQAIITAGEKGFTWSLPPASLEDRVALLERRMAALLDDSK